MSAPPAYEAAPPPEYQRSSSPRSPLPARPRTPQPPPIFTLSASTGQDTAITTTSSTHTGYHIPASLSSALSSFTLSRSSRAVFTIHRHGLLTGTRGARIQLWGSKVYVLSGLSKFGFRGSEDDVAMRVSGGEIKRGAKVLAKRRRYKQPGGEGELEGLEVLEEDEGLVDAIAAIWVAAVWVKSWEMESIGSRVKKLARKGARGEIGGLMFY